MESQIHYYDIDQLFKECVEW